MKKTFLTMLALSLFALTACGDNAETLPQDLTNNANNNTQIQELRSTKARASVADLPQDDLDSFYKSQRAFSFKVYGELLKEEKPNLFYSSLSISQALSMLYVGARGNTADQMKDALQFTLNDALIHQGWNHLDQALASRGQGAKDSNGDPFKLKVTNALWVKLGFNLLDAFLDTLAQEYGAGLKGLNFTEDPEGARKIINDWVAAQTEDKIKDLLPQGSIQSNTALVLTNAIYFNAAWQFPFEESATTSAEFTGIDGQKVNVDMMSQEEGFNTGVAQDGTRVLELPYSGGELSMIILMPADGQLGAVESKLDEARYQEYQGAASYKHIKLSLPKFKFETDYDMIPTMKSLGMTDAFDGSADLSGINGSGGLYVSGIMHSAFVSVSEKGTEAAAATAVVVGETSVPVVEDEVKIDKPFIFVIRDNVTDVPLFMGRVGTI